MLQKVTPILRVEKIEPSLGFWVDRLGFTKVVEVNVGDELGFVILRLGHVEVMLQSRASLAKDIPSLATGALGSSVVYIGATELDELEKKLEGAPIVVPRRNTEYGATEIWVKEPGGHVVGFAAPA